MIDENAIQDLSEILTCPVCDLEIPHVTALQNSKDRPHKGDVLICSGCASILKVGDLDLVAVKSGELKQLDPQSKSRIMLAVKSCLIAIAAKNRTK